MKKIKMGIIGTGYTIGIAKSHVQAFQANERIESAALYDLYRELIIGGINDAV